MGNSKKNLKKKKKKKRGKKNAKCKIRAPHGMILCISIWDHCFYINKYIYIYIYIYSFIYKIIWSSIGNCNTK